MKKIYKIKSLAVVTLAMLANVAFGQNLKVTSEGNPVANGDVIELPYVFEDQSYPEYDLYSYSYKWDPHLEASTAEGEASLTVTVIMEQDAEGFQLCWPQNCVLPLPNGNLTSTSTINTTPQDLQIHKEFTTENKDEYPSVGGRIKVILNCGSESMEVTVNALLSDKNGVGQNIEDINTETAYYTLQGMRVGEPRRGQLYIVRKAGKATKRIY